MVVGSDARFMSGIRSSPSSPSPCSSPCPSPWLWGGALSCAAAGGPSEATSFMPHRGHVAGPVAVTSGCIGQA